MTLGTIRKYKVEMEINIDSFEFEQAGEPERRIESRA